MRARQFIEQEPGPPGCPQEPQGAGAALRADPCGDSAPTAKTEICFSNCVPPHVGHLNSVLARTSNSKSWLQVAQRYS